MLSGSWFIHDKRALKVGFRYVQLCALAENIDYCKPRYSYGEISKS